MASPMITAVDPHIRISGARRGTESIRWLGGSRELLTGDWIIPYADRQQLAHALSTLRDEGVLFADAPHGWPPAAVFEHLRDAGLVSGSFKAVTWRGPDDPLITVK